MGTGDALVEAAKRHARKKGWTRLELCTPPVPEFEPVVTFYGRRGFSVTGGRKMKVITIDMARLIETTRQK